MANSPIDLLDKLKAIDITVPSCNEGRTKNHREYWPICRFLATYADTEFIQYPMRVKKGERPDFQLCLQSKHIGIEIIEAIFPDLARVNKRSDELKSNKPIFVRRYKMDKSQMSRNEIDKIANGVPSQDPDINDAWAKDWAQKMEFCIIKKIDKFSSPGFEKFESNWLLIYDNLGLMPQETKVDYLFQRLVKTDVPVPFDFVFIESHCLVWQFNKTNYCSIQINNIWKNNKNQEPSL